MVSMYARRLRALLILCVLLQGLQLGARPPQASAGARPPQAESTQRAVQPRAPVAATRLAAVPTLTIADGALSPSSLSVPAGKPLTIVSTATQTRRLRIAATPPKPLTFLPLLRAKGAARDIQQNAPAPAQAVADELITLQPAQQIQRSFDAHGLIYISEHANPRRLATISVVEDNDDGNYAPLAYDIEAWISGDQPALIDLDLYGGLDPEGLPLTYTLATTPSYGLTQVVSGTLLYTPTELLDYDEAEVLDYIVSDSGGETAQASVFIRQLPPNLPPLANNRSLTVDGTQPITIDLGTLVADNKEPELAGLDDPLHTYRIIEAPRFGSASLLSATLTYQPASPLTKTDHLLYEVSDIWGELGQGVIELRPARPESPLLNHKPRAQDATLKINRGEVGALDLRALASDPDGDMLTITLQTVSISGSASLLGGMLSYTPTTVLSQGIVVEELAYRLVDGDGAWDEGLISAIVADAELGLPPEIFSERPARLELSPSAALLSGPGDQQPILVRAYDHLGLQVPLPPEASGALRWSAVSQDAGQALSLSYDQSDPMTATVRAEAPVGYLQLKAEWGGMRSRSSTITAMELQPGVVVVPDAAVRAPVLMTLPPALTALGDDESAMRAWIDAQGPNYTLPPLFKTVLNPAALPRPIGPGSLLTAGGASTVAGRVVSTRTVTGGMEIVFATAVITEIIARAELAAVYGPEDLYHGGQDPLRRVGGSYLRPIRGAAMPPGASGDTRFDIGGTIGHRLNLHKSFGLGRSFRSEHSNDNASASIGGSISGELTIDLSVEASISVYLHVNDFFNTVSFDVSFHGGASAEVKLEFRASLSLEASVQATAFQRSFPLARLPAFPLLGIALDLKLAPSASVQAEGSIQASISKRVEASMDFSASTDGDAQASAEAKGLDPSFKTELTVSAGFHARASLKTTIGLRVGLIDGAELKRILEQRRGGGGESEEEEEEDDQSCTALQPLEADLKAEANVTYQPPLDVVRAYIAQKNNSDTWANIYKISGDPARVQRLNCEMQRAVAAPHIEYEYKKNAAAYLFELRGIDLSGGKLTRPLTQRVNQKGWDATETINGKDFKWDFKLEDSETCVAIVDILRATKSKGGDGIILPSDFTFRDQCLPAETNELSTTHKLLRPTSSEVVNDIEEYMQQVIKAGPCGSSGSGSGSGGTPDRRENGEDGAFCPIGPPPEDPGDGIPDWLLEWLPELNVGIEAAIDAPLFVADYQTDFPITGWRLNYGNGRYGVGVGIEIRMTGLLVKAAKELEKYTGVHIQVLLDPLFKDEFITGYPEVKSSNNPNADKDFEAALCTPDNMAGYEDEYVKITCKVEQTECPANAQFGGTITNYYKHVEYKGPAARRFFSYNSLDGVLGNLGRQLADAQIEDFAVYLVGTELPNAQNVCENKPKFDRVGNVAHNSAETPEWLWSWQWDDIPEGRHTFRSFTKTPVLPFWLYSITDVNKWQESVDEFTVQVGDLCAPDPGQEWELVESDNPCGSIEPMQFKPKRRPRPGPLGGGGWGPWGGFFGWFAWGGGGGGGARPPLADIPLAKLWGDPHISTMDGLAYTSAHLGEFIYASDVLSDALELQVRQQRLPGFPGWASFATAAALRFERQVLEVRLPAPAAPDRSLALLLDGEPLDLAPGSYLIGAALLEVGQGNAITLWTRDPTAPGQLTRVRIGTRSENLVGEPGSGPAVALDISMETTPNGRFHGLLGRPDGNRDNELTRRDRSLTQSKNLFHESWRVETLADSLFTYAQGQSPATFNMQQDAFFPTPAALEQGPRNYMQEARDLLSGTCGANLAAIDTHFIYSLAIELAAGRTAQNMLASGLCFDEHVEGAGQPFDPLVGLQFSGSVSLAGAPEVDIPGARVTIRAVELGNKLLCDSATFAGGGYSCGLTDYAQPYQGLQQLTLLYRVTGRGDPVTRTVTLAPPAPGGWLEQQLDLEVSPDNVLLLTGRIYGADGLPAGNAPLRVSGPAFVQYATDADGYYRFYMPLPDGIRSGELAYRAASPDFRSEASLVLPFDLTGSGIHTITQDLQLAVLAAPAPPTPEPLERRLVFSGKLSNQHAPGSGVAGALVEIRSPAIYGGVCQATSTAGGGYSCPTILTTTAPFTAALRVSRVGSAEQTLSVGEEHIPAPGGSLAKVTDLTLAPATLRISGVIRDAGGDPLEGASIQATSPEVGGIVTSATASSGPGGAYELTLVLPNALSLDGSPLAGEIAYRLSYGMAGSTSLYQASRPFAVASGALANLSENFSFGGHTLALTGRVRNALVDGFWVSGALVTISSPQLGVLCQVQTDQLGYYACEAFAPNSYDIDLNYQVSKRGSATASQEIDLTGAQLGGRYPVVQSFYVSPTTLQVTGVVSSTAGSAVPGAQVGASLPGQGANTTSGAGGAYGLYLTLDNGLAAGTLNFSARYQGESGVASTSATRNFTALAGQLNTISQPLVLDLGPAGVDHSRASRLLFAGSVFNANADGAPLAGAVVTVRGAGADAGLGTLCQTTVGTGGYQCSALREVESPLEVVYQASFAGAPVSSPLSDTYQVLPGTQFSNEFNKDLVARPTTLKLSGRITDLSDRPLAGAIFQSSQPGSASASADAQGDYETYLPLPATTISGSVGYQVSYRDLQHGDAQPFGPLTPGEQNALPPLVTKLPFTARAVVLQGQVSNSVAAQARQGIAVAIASPQLGQLCQTATDASGRYSCSIALDSAEPFSATYTVAGLGQASDGAPFARLIDQLPEAGGTRYYDYNMTVAATAVRVSGTIKNASNSAVQNATVRLTGAFEASALSGASGSFEHYQVLPEGSGPGSLSVSAAYGVSSGATTASFAPAPRALTQVELGTIVLTPPPVPPAPTDRTVYIQGVVRAQGPAGLLALPQATVAISTSVAGQGCQTSSGADGRYSCRLTFASGDPVDLTIAVSGRGSARFSGTITELPPGGGVAAFQKDFLVQPTILQLTGSVADARGWPLVNALVEVSGPAAGSARTGSDGRYTIYLFLDDQTSAGSLSYKVSYGTQTLLLSRAFSAPPSQITTINLPITLNGRTIVFRGQLLNSVLPSMLLPGVSVVISSTQLGPLCATTTNASGLYSCSVTVETGQPFPVTHRVEASWGDYRFENDVTNLPAVGTSGEYALALSVAPTIIQLSGHAGDSAGNPLPGTQVIVSGDATGQGSTGSNGDYTLYALVKVGKSSVRLNLEFRYGAYVIQRLSNPIALALHQINQHREDLLITTGKVQISGTVVNSTTLPVIQNIPHAQVRLSTPDGSTWCSTSANSNGSFSCPALSIATSNNFTFTATISGSWGMTTQQHVIAMADLPPLGQQRPYSFAFKGTPDTLKLAGVVRDNAGNLLSGAQVRASNTRFLNTYTYGTTNAAGEYTIYPILQSGTITVPVAYYVSYASGFVSDSETLGPLTKPLHSHSRNFTLQNRQLRISAQVANGHRMADSVEVNQVRVSSPTLGEICKLSGPMTSVSCSKWLIIDQPFSVTYELTGTWGVQRFDQTVTSIPGPGQTITLSPRIPTYPTTFNLTGVISDGTSPLQGVAVSLSSPLLRYSYSATTDSQGRYQFYPYLKDKATSSGSFSIQASRGSAAETLVYDFAGVSHGALITAPLSLLINEQRVSVTGMISGTLLGQPLDNSEVRIKVGGETMCVDYSDPAGRYECIGMFPATYPVSGTLIASGGWGVLSDTIAVAANTVGGTQSIVGPNFFPQTTALRVTGLVSSVAGAPLPNAAVRIGGPDSHHERTGLTDASGRYTVTVVLRTGISAGQLRYHVVHNGISRAFMAPFSGVVGQSVNLHSQDMQAGDVYGITTVAGSGRYYPVNDGGSALEAGLDDITGLAMGADGSLYIADRSHYRVRRVAPNGSISTIAGTGRWGYSGDGGPATQAQIRSLQGLAIGPDGSLYIADSSAQVIRRVAPDGTISTIAGNGTSGFGASGVAATSTSLLSPNDLEIGPDGSLYFIESSRRLRRIAPNGSISTIAGSTFNDFYGDGGPAINARFSGANGVAVAPDGSIYISELNNSRLRYINTSGIISTIAGNGSRVFSGDGGLAKNATFQNMGRIELAPDGGIFVVDAMRVRYIGRDGMIRTVAGNGLTSYNQPNRGDGGPAQLARIGSPGALLLAPDGSLYLGDLNSGLVRRLVAPLLSLRGRVADTQGNPLAGARMRADGLVPASQPGVASRADGSYELLVGELGALSGGVTLSATLENQTIAHTLSLTLQPGQIAQATEHFSEPLRRVVFNGKLLNGHLSGSQAELLRSSVTISSAGVPLCSAASGETSGDYRCSAYLPYDQGTLHPLDYAVEGAWGQALITGSLDLATGPAPLMTHTLNLQTYPTTLIISGTVSDGAGRRVPDAHILVLDAHHGGDAWSGNDGYYDTSLVLPEDYDSALSFYLQPEHTGFPITFEQQIEPPAPGTLSERTIDIDIGRVRPWVLETFAGILDEYGYSGDGGPARLAMMDEPAGLAFGQDGSLYIADSENSAVRRVDPTGVITTVAGTGIWGSSGDGGPARLAQLGYPHDLAFGPDGSLYIADSENSVVRRIDASGVISTVAGDPEACDFYGDDGPASSAALCGPHAVAFGPDGSLYIADTYNDAIRKVTPDGIISTIIGGGFYDPSDGSLAINAAIYRPYHIVVAPDGTIFFTEQYEYHVRKITPDGRIFIVAGNDDSDYYGDGGPARQAALAGPIGLALGPDGALYIADWSDEVVRRVGPEGIITTVAGNIDWLYQGEEIPALQARLDDVYGLAFDTAGRLYIGEVWGSAVRRIEPATFSVVGSLISEDGLALWGEVVISGTMLTQPYSLSGEEETIDDAGTYRLDLLHPNAQPGQSGTLTITTIVEGFSVSQTLAITMAPAGEATWIDVPTPVMPLKPVSYYGEIYNSLIPAEYRWMNPMLDWTVRITDSFGLGCQNTSVSHGSWYGCRAVMRYDQQRAIQLTRHYSGSWGGVVLSDTLYADSARSYLQLWENVPISPTTVELSGTVKRQNTWMGGTQVYLLGSDLINWAQHSFPPSGRYRLYAGLRPGVLSTTLTLYADLYGNGKAFTITPTGLLSNSLTHIDYDLQMDNLVWPTISTIAGTGAAGYSGDNGLATASSLYNPASVAVAPNGVYYIADSFNNRIRKVGLDDKISTVAGTGTAGYNGDNVLATQARINRPTGIALGPAGELYIADTDNHRVRKVGLDGKISTVAGTGVLGYSGDGGPATQAQINGPGSLALGPDGSLYIVERAGQRVRKVAPNGTISTIAGTGVWGYSGDGGPATQAQLSAPSDIALGPDGSLYIADLGNLRVRKIAPNGIISTIAGSGNWGNNSFNGAPMLALKANLNGPRGIAIAADGALYIADGSSIRRIDPAGVVAIVAGLGSNGYSGDGGVGIYAQVNNTFDVAIGPSGALFIADYGNQRIRKVLR